MSEISQSQSQVLPFSLTQALGAREEGTEKPFKLYLGDLGKRMRREAVIIARY